MVRAVVRGGCGGADSALHFPAEHVGGDDGLAIRAALFSQGERGGQARGRAVRRRDSLYLEVEAVAEYAVGERGGGGVGLEAAPGHGAERRAA